VPGQQRLSIPGTTLPPIRRTILDGFPRTAMSRGNSCGRQCPRGCMRLTHGAYATCTGTCLNGAGTGTEATLGVR
jgi:hypothetical protein